MKASKGFTLIEVLMASAILALMALISWRGLDGMFKTQTALQTRSDATQNLQMGMAQWRTDLDNMLVLQGTPALEWDGRVMRITRQHSQDPKAGVQVVAWTLGNGQWTRWQSEPLMQNDAWTQAWTQAQIWAESAGNLKANTAQEVVIHPVQTWQIYFHRDGAWTNALSSDVNTNSNTNGKSSLQNLPEGLRLVLELADRPEIQGKVTMDWVRPTFTAVKQ
ncbi:type II secretion system protein J [Limnohabitans sp. Rim11]|uniref:PulJ/GspJ family protein n=1 Tax=Limnohabitans sp. Rim11 TaxID=1100719 RepID=UPI000AD7B82B|nr:prepilin-type N-terminal cleavage/methylation domain-containing protein [Limnohabitans sp. Rim11]